MKNIIKRLNMITYINYSLTILFLILIIIFQKFGNREANRFNSTLVLVLTTFFSIAFPILLRTGYYQKSIKAKGLKLSEYFKFKLSINISVFIGSLCALIGYYFPIYKYHLYLSIFVGLWGIYSIIPSSKIIEKDFIAYNIEREE